MYAYICKPTHYQTSPITQEHTSDRNVCAHPRNSRPSRHQQPQTTALSDGPSTPHQALPTGDCGPKPCALCSRLPTPPNSLNHLEHGMQHTPMTSTGTGASALPHSTCTTAIRTPGLFIYPPISGVPTYNITNPLLMQIQREYHPRLRHQKSP